MSEQIKDNEGNWLESLAAQLKPGIEASIAAEPFDEHDEIRTVTRELEKAIFEQTGVEE